MSLNKLAQAYVQLSFWGVTMEACTKRIVLMVGAQDKRRCVMLKKSQRLEDD